MKTGVIAFPLDRPVGGGIDRYVHRLAKEFHLGPTPGEFVWIHGRPFSDAETLKGAREVVLKEGGLGGALSRRKWARANPEKLDVLFGPYFGVMPGPFKKVMTVHDLYAFTSSDAGFFWTARFRAATKRMARMSDFVLADSDASRKQVVDFLEVPAERVVTVRLGVDPVPPLSPAERGFARAELRKGQSWPQDTRVILFVGALIPRKDPMILVRAFGRIREKRPDVRMIMIGATTPASPPVAVEVAQDGLSPNVFLPGHADEAALAAAYAGADVFVLPSRFEGFGLPVLEAMAHGLPVVCSTAGSLAEIGEGAASMFPPGDEDALVDRLNRVLDDPAEAARMSKAGLEHVKQFTWARCAKETYAVLESAAKR